MPTSKNARPWLGGAQGIEDTISHRLSAMTASRSGGFGHLLPRRLFGHRGGAGIAQRAGAFALLRPFSWDRLPPTGSTPPCSGQPTSDFSRRCSGHDWPAVARVALAEHRHLPHRRKAGQMNHPCRRVDRPFDDRHLRVPALRSPPPRRLRLLWIPFQRASGINMVRT